MSRPDLAIWRIETAAVDTLVDGLLARDGMEQAEAVSGIPDDDDEAYGWVSSRALLLLLSSHALHGPD